MSEEMISEMRKDINELLELQKQTTRKNVLYLLSQEVKEIEMTCQEESLRNTAQNLSLLNLQSDSDAQRYHVQLRSYGWDQTDKYIKLFIMLKNVHNLPKERVYCKLTERSVELHVDDLDNTDFVLNIDRLLGRINIQECREKLQNDMIVVFLAKSTPNVNWPRVTEQDMYENIDNSDSNDDEDEKSGKNAMVRNKERPFAADDDRKPERPPKILKRNAIPSVFPWSQTSQKPEQSLQEQSLPQDFDPSKVLATYSKTPPIAFVEMPVLAISTQMDEYKDPLQLLNLEVNNLSAPLQSPSNQEMECQEPESGVFADSASEANYVSVPMQSPSNQEMEYQEPEPLLFLEEDENTIEIETETQSIQTQTGDTKGYSESYTGSASASTQTQNYMCSLSVYDLKENVKRLHFYTGLENFKKCMLVFHSLGKATYNLNYFYGPPPERIDALEQFFITLIILRRHTTFEDISMLFDITVKHVYSILITWIRFMSLQWRLLDIWVDKETVKAYAPFDFYEKYPATRVILDATECPIKKPKLPFAQQVTFSSYKNRNTIKCIVGITPGGLINYVSPAYGGSATDRQTIERSTILDRFNYNDEIMVDKGLNVQDIFVPYGVKVNMPAFFRKGNQISSDTLASNRKVASKRVHVERVIGMMKTFKILSQPMNQTEVLLSSDIVFVIAMLVNFRSNIISKNA